MFIFLLNYFVYLFYTKIVLFTYIISLKKIYIHYIAKSLVTPF